MPELRSGKQFLYRLIVSQLQKDGFVNVATSLSIATIGQTKIIPSDRLHNLISLCAQVVRDTDAEVIIDEKENATEQNGEGETAANTAPTPTTPDNRLDNRQDNRSLENHTVSGSDMGSQHSAFHPALSHLLQNQGAPVKEDEMENTLTQNKNLQNKGGAEEMTSAAALKSLHQLQMLKVFSNMTEATRQAYLQTQAMQKKPFYMTPSGTAFTKDQQAIRPFPLSTPDIKTPRCRSTLLPFTGTSQDTSTPNFNFNGEQEIKIESTQNIHAMEEIIKLTEEKIGLPTSTPISTSSSGAGGIPLSFLHTDSAIQELIVQRQLKQRRFKDLDCSFVSKLIQQPNLVNNLVNSVPDHKPKIDFNSVLSRLSASALDPEHKLVTSPPSLPPTTGSLSQPPGNIVEELLSSSVAAAVGTSSSSSGDQARYECPRCARVFAYEYVLQTHMRQVCPDRSNYKHPCTVCKKRFQNQSSLKRHMIVHTGERKYECEVCHKRFGRSHHLKRHVKIHEMEAANYTQHHGGGGTGQEGTPTGSIPEETLQLILQLGAMNKFPLSPASLIDSAMAEDMMSNCDSIEDGDSQGDIDMEDPVSDAGEVSVENSADEERAKPILCSAGSILCSAAQTASLLSSLSQTAPVFSSAVQSAPIFSSVSALSIQNILNNTTPLFYNSEIKKPVVTLVPPIGPAAPLVRDVITPSCDVITPSCDVITPPRDTVATACDVTPPTVLPKISLSPEAVQPTL